MKKIIIGALVGGILVFAWQTLSWTMLELHGKAYQYTEKQQEILDYLSSQLTEGGYIMPGHKPDATAEEMEAAQEAAKGKPWAVVAYHASYDMNMTTNIIRGLLIDILMVGLFCWILSKITAPGFGTVFLASLLTGLIVFFNAPYTGHIWFQSFDLMAHLTDALVSWGLCGIWLGWWYSRK